MSDILVECDKQRLGSMLAVLKRHLPTQIQQYNFVYNYLYHYDRINGNRERITSDRWNLRLYGHRNGDLDNCTLVTLCGKRNYTLVCFTLQPSQLELKECLQKTKLIKWDNDPLDILMDERLFKTVNEVACEKVDIDWIYLPIEHILHISKENIEKLPLTEKLPDNVYMAPLDSELHSQIIDDTWHYKSENSLALIRQSIELNGGVGLFRRGEEQPFCWIATSEFFTPGFLYTLKSDRGQGYAQLIMKVELKRMLKNHGLDLFTYVSVENEPSLALHRKLGFESVSTVAWMVKSP